MRYPWNGSVSRKYRNARWRGVRRDGERTKTGSLRGLRGVKVDCTIWMNRDLCV
ncbi:mobilization protein [Salmonella enterica subsp. enterica serovar Infantis]|nr:mobilization protein [Salmonella enterica subsp. enterica serovar Infantis]